MTVNYEQIDNYLHNDLTGAARTAFEAEMAADPALAEAVNLYRDVEAQMRGATQATVGEAALQTQLQALSQQYFGKKGNAPVMEMTTGGPADADQVSVPATKAPVIAMRRRRMLYYIAGAAAVVLALIWIRPFGGTPQFDADAVYAQFGAYEVPTWGNTRGGDNAPLDKVAQMKMQVDSLFSQAQPQYATALPILEQLASQNENDPAIALAKAACYTETNDSARAMQTLTTVEAQTKGKLKSQATFYKAKLYIKYKDVEGCRKALQTITGDDDWANKAKDLLKALPKQ